jgi:hypothetical protein
MPSVSSTDEFGCTPNSVTLRTCDGRVGSAGSAVQAVVSAVGGGGAVVGGESSTGAPMGGGADEGGSALATLSEPPPHPAVARAADKQKEKSSGLSRTGIAPLLCPKLPVAS